MVISIEKTNQKNHVSFMPHAFSESEHRFSQCGHFNQVEPFEKSRFLIIFPLLLKPTFALVQARGHNYENTLKHI
jgi:hypothetical protein